MATRQQQVDHGEFSTSRTIALEIDKTKKVLQKTEEKLIFRITPTVRRSMGELETAIKAAAARTTKKKAEIEFQWRDSCQSRRRQIRGWCDQILRIIQRVGGPRPVAVSGSRRERQLIGLRGDFPVHLQRLA